MRRRIAMLLLLVFVAAAVTAAQEEAPLPTRRKVLTSTDQTREFTEAFLRTLVTSRPYDAFALIKTVVPDSEIDVDRTRISTEELLQEVRPNFGSMIEAEHLATKSLGASFVRYDYLLKFDRNALHCRIIYYSARKNWVPVGIWFTEIDDQLYEDLGK